MGIHCAVDHWGALSYGNSVAIDNWKKNLRSTGAFGKTRTHELRGIATDMRLGRRPIERAAIVFAGAVFSDDLEFRGWLKSTALKTGGRKEDIEVAAIYGLGAHCDRDEDLVDALVLSALRWQSFPKMMAQVRAISDVISIWRTSKGSGTCAYCAPSTRAGEEASR